MFQQQWFPKNFFAPNYWPKTGAKAKTGHGPKGGGKRFFMAYAASLIAADGLRILEESRRVQAVRSEALRSEFRRLQEQELIRLNREWNNGVMAVLLSEV